MRERDIPACRNRRNKGKRSCVPQCPGETQSLSVVGEVRRARKEEEDQTGGRGQWDLAHCPKAIVPGSVMVNASQKGHLGSSGEGGSSA